MSELKKEKTMLKWLKQKPNHLGHGAVPIEKITDDPLATIQVHPHAKKSKNKANEIYAVSRVNPLFEEEDAKEVFSPSGNSGSSGYDSGSGPSDDDFPIIHNVATDLKGLQANLLGRLQTSPSPSTPIVGATTTTLKTPQLFINTENDIIHHETAIVGRDGRPVLQILEQNPQYVKSIALSVANTGRKRPLSPISESNTGPPPPNLLSPLPPPPVSPPVSKYNLTTSGSLKDAKRFNSSNAYTTIDSIGSARLVKKDSQYVKSIRIGGPTNFSTTATKRSLLEGNRRFSSGSSTSSSSNIPVSTRRPSVTFADDVGSRSGSRKPSMEQDSIVTESLLMMTSVGGGLGGDHPLTRRFSNASSSSHSRKTSVSSSQSKSQDESSEIGSTSNSSRVDLEAFANSLRKSRPIKQIGRNHGGGGSADELEEERITSNENLGEGANPSGRAGGGMSTLDRPTTPLKTTAPSASPPMSPTQRLHATKKSHKSPFGGIADHYAAAKEIAKEIESYSNGSAKASTKKSLVRDLLYRGNRNAATSSGSSPPNVTVNAIKIVPAVTSANPPISREHTYGAIGQKGFRAVREDRPSTNNTSTSSNIPQRDLSRQINTKSQERLQSPEPYHQGLLMTAPRNTVSSPTKIYYESPAYGTSGAKLGGNSRLTNYTSSRPQSPGGGGGVAITNSGGGASNDWELVRVQQVYVKALPGPQGTLPTQDEHPKRKTDTWASTTKAAVHSTNVNPHQGQDHTVATGNTVSTTNSRRHPASSKTIAAGAASSSASSIARGKAAKKVPSSTDDGLPAGARSRIQNDESDSGNSSDRTYAEVRLEIEGTRIELPGEPYGTSSEARIQVEDDSALICGTLPRPENLPSKVMIVTGDSQNIVVDLSGVPLDLKNAIVSGTALITLPDGLDKMLQPGYTMITIPASAAGGNSSRPMSPKSPHPPHHPNSQLPPEGILSPGGPLRTTTTSTKDGGRNKALGRDDDKPLVRSGGSSASGSDDECKLFATKNKAQIWDVIQQTVGKTHEDGEKKGKKKITTIFPFHPNQDAYESPDFTIEGHRLDRQRKKVEHEKRRRCACRLCGMLFFLVAFLGVLVALSMIYTRGQRYFGSSV